MSRLVTSGWETGALNEISTTNSGTVVTTPVRSGKYALQFAAFLSQTILSAGTALGRNYYVRAWINFPAAPSAVQYLMGMGTEGSAGVWVRINTDRTITLTHGTGTRGPSAALAVNTWHLIELRFKIVSGTADESELRVNGTLIGSVSGTAAWDTVPSLKIGRTQSGTFTVTYDDIAINDDQGSAENSWPDSNGIVTFLKAVADGAINTWRNPTGVGNTNLFDCVDNIPPVGVAAANLGSGATQIYENAGGNDPYEAVLEKYADKAPGVIKLVQPLGWHAVGSAGALNNGIAGKTNPAIAEATIATSAAAAGAFPANWTPGRGNIAYGDISDKATPPVVTVRKISVSGVGDYFAQVGMLVEYAPPQPVTNNDVASGAIVLDGSCIDSWSAVTGDVYHDSPTAYVLPGDFFLGGSVDENFVTVAGYPYIEMGQCDRCRDRTAAVYVNDKFGGGSGKLCMYCWNETNRLGTG